MLCCSPCGKPLADPIGCQPCSAADAKVHVTYGFTQPEAYSRCSPSSHLNSDAQLGKCKRWGLPWLTSPPRWKSAQGKHKIIQEDGAAARKAFLFDKCKAKNFENPATKADANAGCFGELDQPMPDISGETGATNCKGDIWAAPTAANPAGT